MKLLAVSAATAAAIAIPARDAHAGDPQPAKLERITHAVMGPLAPAFRCLAHYESTDGAHLYNGRDLGPWQVDVIAHRWVNAARLVRDWWYAARVALALSEHGRDWTPWPTTRRSCGL